MSSTTVESIVWIVGVFLFGIAAVAPQHFVRVLGRGTVNPSPSVRCGLSFARHSSAMISPGLLGGAAHRLMSDPRIWISVPDLWHDTTCNVAGSALQMCPQFLVMNQSFNYDKLNRLTSASDSGGWSRTFNYDQTGNMWVTNPVGGPWSGSTPTTNAFTNDRINGASYD